MLLDMLPRVKKVFYIENLTKKYLTLQLEATLLSINLQNG